MIKLTDEQWMNLTIIISSYRADILSMGEDTGEDVSEYVAYLDSIVDEILNTQDNWEVDFEVDWDNPVSDDELDS